MHCESSAFFVLFYRFKFHGSLKKVTVNGKRKLAAHQLGEPARNGKSEPGALGIAGGIAANEACRQLVGGNVQAEALIGVLAFCREKDDGMLYIEYLRSVFRLQNSRKNIKNQQIFL